MQTAQRPAKNDAQFQREKFLFSFSFSQVYKLQVCNRRLLVCLSSSDPVVKIVLLDDSSQSSSTSHDYDHQLIDHAATLFSPSSIRTVENHPCRIRCVAFGGYPPPSLEVHVGQRVVTAEFAFRNAASLRPSPVHAAASVPASATVVAVRPEDGATHAVNGGGGIGSRGLRAIDYQSERWTTNFLARAEDDESLMKCVSVVPGLKPAVVVVKLHVDCKLTCIKSSVAIATMRYRQKRRRSSLVQKLPREFFLSTMQRFCSSSIATLIDIELVFWSRTLNRLIYSSAMRIFLVSRSPKLYLDPRSDRRLAILQVRVQISLTALHHRWFATVVSAENLHPLILWFFQIFLKIWP